MTDNSTGTSTITLSTVTPVYCGEKYLRTLVEHLDKLRVSLDHPDSPLRLIEAIFADDGSIDESAEELRKLQTDYPWVRVVTLSRNFGQHGATVAGLLHSSGDWIVTLDEDLQHHPQHIMPLLRKAISASRDIVYAHPVNDVHRSLFRDLSSRQYKKLLSYLSGNPFVSSFNSFRVIRGSIARAAASVASHETYLDVALGWFTSRVSTLSLPLVDHRYVESGASGYSVRSLLRHARRLFISSEIKALRLGGVVGLISILASCLLTLYVLYSMIWKSVQGWSSIMIAITFFGGTACLLSAVTIEYLSVLLVRAQGKPTFFVVDRESDERIRGWFQTLEQR
jgi:glycosyltransferase involved in cell wall biosynthesis